MASWLSSSAGEGIRFESTQWSLVSAAAAEGETGQTALKDLYQSYCYPVYAFVRRQGYNRPDAQDATHDFFLYLLEKDLFNRAAAGQGKFRSFLLKSLKFFLQHANRRAGAQKRGGNTTPVFLDDETAEETYQLIDPGLTPEQIFDAQWALTLIDEALARLRSEMEGAGKDALFHQLSGFLVDDQEASYVEVAERTGLSVSAVKAAIYRLRLRYRELLRAEVARTVASSPDFESELGALQSLLGG
jgi:RNA polymerase sigma factor (sigma-70 family)